MKVGLFIPCYIDQFYPSVGIATLELLEKLGCQVEYPLQQTCCGQPLANSGMEQEAEPIYRHFVQTFQNFEHIVVPSGSCAHHVRHHYHLADSQTVRERTFDLVEFLVDILQIDHLQAHFPHKVGLHQSCHGLRGLRLGSSSELMTAPFSKVRYLLGMVKDLELMPLDRLDECCGFGGTFAVNEPELSAKMGKDRIADHLRNRAEYITSNDMSCLMHLEGLIRRQNLPIQVVHLAEILNNKMS